MTPALKVVPDAVMSNHAPLNPSRTQVGVAPARSDTVTENWKVVTVVPVDGVTVPASIVIRPQLCASTRAGNPNSPMPSQLTAARTATTSERARARGRCCAVGFRAMT